jgi:hypothetical protein
MFSSKRSGVVAAGIAAVVIGFAGGIGGGSGGQGSNARSGPAAGGSIGTASSVSASGFTLTTATGGKVTIKEASSTTYEQGTSPATVSAVTSGAPVLVLGTTDSTTITATEVTVDPPSTNASSLGGQVQAFSKGTNHSNAQVGTIPSHYNQGSGTSPAARPRTRPPKPRWPSTRAGSSTGS